MFDPRGQPQSREKAAMLENVPWTLNLSGEWAPVRTDSFRAWGLAWINLMIKEDCVQENISTFEHQTFAPLSQNICLCV